jgi:ribosomal protein S12 methylthiotransferase
MTTLGCAKNVYDSEIIMGQLMASGVPLLQDPDSADILIINTCGFITPAKKESIETILEAVTNKNKNMKKKVIVIGCLSQRYEKDLKTDIPEVDKYFGTEDYSKLMQYLDLEPTSPEHLYEKRFLLTKSHYAYLKISEGCHHKCAFCAIPKIRGRHRSRPFENIIKEAEILANKGVKELILIAQDTTFYGLDLYQKQRIIELIEAFEKIDGIRWIRLHYAYPTTFQEELIDRMVQSDKLLHYVDIPFQHVSDKMLKIMKRGSTEKSIRKILSKLREKIPDIAIRTTFIIGHPGEGEKEFRKLKEFIKEYKFERLGLFIYSPEEDTAAFHLSYPEKSITEKRYNEIMQIQKEISFDKNQSHIGRDMTILVDELDKQSHTAFGRSYADSPEIDNEVIFENIPTGIKKGQFYDAKIIAASEYELFGQLLEVK